MQRFCSSLCHRKYMKAILSCVLVFFFLTVHAQTLQLFTGYGRDMNNTSKAFNFIPVKIKWFPFQEKPLSIFANYDFGLDIHGRCEAYTLNPDLPSRVMLKEFAKTDLLTLGLDLNISLYTTGAGNQVHFFFSPIALTFQRFKASYPEFDKENYEILNQDISRNSSGLAFILGLDYRFNHNKIVALDFNTPLLKRRPGNFNYLYAAPLRLMVGYQFSFMKSRKN